MNVINSYRKPFLPLFTTQFVQQVATKKEVRKKNGKKL